MNTETPLRIWLVSVGEPLPVDGPEARLFRIGLLHHELALRGHHVVWWSSTFEHARKQQRAHENTTVGLTPTSELRMIHAPAYPRSVSLRRLVNHALLGRGFRRWASQAPRPDVVLACMPTLELAAEATALARRLGVPSIVDIRDPWPEAFLDFVPRWIRPAAKLGMWPLFERLRLACGRATALTATTPAFLDWGAAHAGRARTALDRSFPLAYDDTPPSPADARQAEAFWDERGVVRDDTLTACFAGTMNYHTDLDTILAVARRARQHGPAMRFVLCGTGARWPELAARAAAEPNVVMPGWVGRPVLWTLLQRAAIGLAPYTDRPVFALNLTNKAIEYLSAGLAIATTTGGTLEQLLHTHDCGFRYPANDPGLLYARLAALASDRARLGTMQHNARTLFEARFRAHTVYAEYADFIESIARHHGEHP